MGFFDKIKDFAGDAGDAISKGAKNVSDSSKKMVEKNKLKSKISKLEEDVEKKYSEIGKQYFKINSDNPPSEYVEMVSFIIDAQKQISELQSEIIAMDNKYMCPVCGAGIAENSKFCSECGSKFEKPVTAEETTEKTKCPDCGAEVDADAKFCTGCGKNFAEETPVVDAEIVE